MFFTAVVHNEVCTKRTGALELFIGRGSRDNKGQQYYPACDHQSVQSVLIFESSSKKAKDTADAFKVLHVEPASEALLCSCQELGFKS